MAQPQFYFMHLHKNNIFSCNEINGKFFEYLIRPGGARDVHAVLGLGAHGPKKVLKKGDVASK